MCTVSSPMRFRGGRSCPHIVCPGSDGTCVCRVPSNTPPAAAGWHHAAAQPELSWSPRERTAREGHDGPAWPSAGESRTAPPSTAPPSVPAATPPGSSSLTPRLCPFCPTNARIVKVTGAGKRAKPPHPDNRSWAVHWRGGTRVGSHLRSQSLRIVDAHGRPNRVSDLRRRTGRSELKCRSLTSKAREGSRPPWV